MTDDTARLFGLILAASVRVEAMKAENLFRTSCGDSPAYVEDAFNIEANYIESLARQIG